MPKIFDNHDDRALADLLGETKAEIRGANERARKIEHELARRGCVAVTGHQYQVTRSRFERMDPDRDKLREYHGEEYRDFLKSVPITRWTATELRGLEKAA